MCGGRVCGGGGGQKSKAGEVVLRSNPGRMQIDVPCGGRVFLQSRKTCLSGPQKYKTGAYAPRTPAQIHFA
ncbi:MAG: hypothetical protein ACPIOQ_19545, partial [Promethearchaeia archaeon]